VQHVFLAPASDGNDDPRRATTSGESPGSAQLIERLRVLVVAGIVTGVVVIGGGSRLAMLLLRLTSADRVRGVKSDDGFVIGRVTLGGTYALLHLGAAVGVIGAVAYRLVAPRLIGPRWFRRLSTGAASGVVVGSMLLHADGVDFSLLTPTWLAISVFIALPGLFGIAIGVVVDRCGRTDPQPVAGRRRRALPVLLLVCFPGTLLVVPVVAVIEALCLAGRRSTRLSKIRASAIYRLGPRLVWLSIAVTGLVATVRDVRAIT